MSDVQVNARNEIWYRETSGNITEIGLTEPFLAKIRSNCWSFIFSKKVVKKGTPLFAVETTDGLLSVLSPVDGIQSENRVTNLARNSPEKLNHNEPIIILFPVTKEAAKEKKAPTLEADWDGGAADTLAAAGLMEANPQSIWERLQPAGATTTARRTVRPVPPPGAVNTENAQTIEVDWRHVPPPSRFRDNFLNAEAAQRAWENNSPNMRRTWYQVHGTRVERRSVGLQVS